MLSALLFDSVSDKQRKSVLRDHEELLRDEATDGFLAVLHRTRPPGSAVSRYVERLRIFVDYFRNDGYRGERLTIEQEGFPRYDGREEELDTAWGRSEVNVAADVCLTLLTTASPWIRRRIVAAFPDILLDGPGIGVFAAMRDTAENDSTRRAYNQLIDSLETARTGGLDSAFPKTARMTSAIGPPNDRGPSYLTKDEAVHLALNEYLYAPTWDRRHAAVMKHRELILTGETCALLAASERSQASGTQQRTWIAVGREKLESCIRYGIDETFSVELPPTFTPIVRNPFRYFKDKGHTDLTKPEDALFQVEVLRQHMMSIDREMAPVYWGVMNIYLVDILAQFPSLENGAFFGEEAIIYGHQAVQIFDSYVDPSRQCEARTLLARAYVMRARGDRPENSRRAIGLARSSYDIAVDNSLSARAAGAAVTLAEAFTARPDGFRLENLRKAQEYCREVLKISPDEIGTPTWAKANLHLAQAILLTPDSNEGVRREGIRASRRAIAALEALPNSSLLLYARLCLAQLYGLVRPGAQQAAYELCLHHINKGLEAVSRTEMPLDWATAHVALGGAYLRYGRLDRTKLALAYDHLRAASDAFADTLPYFEIATLNILAEVYFEEENWTECSALLSSVTDVGAFTEGMTVNATGMLAEIEQTTDAYEKLAYCLYKMGRLDEALLRLENGKARLRMDRVAQVSDRYQPPPLVEIPWRDLSDAGALVLPLITDHGGVVFVVTWKDGSPVLSHVPMPGFTRQISTMMFFGSQLRPGWFPAYSRWLRKRENGTEWLTTLIDTCRLAWALLMGPVQKHLSDIGIRPGANVVVLPGQWLSLLPLAAAGFIADGKPRYFADDYTVSFAPNLRALAASARHVRSRTHSQKLQALVDPTGDLPGTHAEWAEIANVSPSATALQGEQASLAALRGELADGCGYLHFACHARFDWQDPHKSGLLLANGDLLTPAIIEQLPLDSVRLVTLSACETGIVESERTPNEFIGLTNAFLTAGAAAVVNSLWAIEDMGTVPLMAAFYGFLFQDHLPPAEALSRAQAHVRGLPGWSHPYYWAGFVCVGA
ncbi:CHAT domain-containing protein [Amycolatopsis sp. NPDC003731]